MEHDQLTGLRNRAGHAAALTGAPATSSVTFDIRGEGFITLPGAFCRFTQRDTSSLALGEVAQVYNRPLSVKSPTTAS